jgi:DNA repair protein RadC
METYSYRLAMIKEQSIEYGKSVCSSETAANLIKQYIGSSDRENLVVLALNIKNDITGIHTVSIGSLNESTGHPREVFKFAILANAAHIILGHNHPSGHIEPSGADIQFTHKIEDAGRLIGIELLDHIIIGDGYYSMKSHGDI